MKNTLNRLKLLLLTGLAAAFSVVDKAADAVTNFADRHLTGASAPQFGLRRQGGFILVGTRPIQGYQPGTVIELSASTEAALVQAGQASVSAGPPTPGNVSTTATGGCAGISAGQSSVTITNPLINLQSIVYAVIAQAAADGTLTSVQRVVPANGSVTIYGNANATAAVSVDWAILNPGGSLTSPQ
jgi:hypothetical protein